MKLGFTLKKAKKGGFQTAASGSDGGNVSHAFDAAPVKQNDAAARVYVTDFDPNAVAPSVGEDGTKSSTLVIPLLKTNEWKALALAAAIEGDEAEEEKNKAGEGVNGETTTVAGDIAAAAPLTEDEIAARQLLAEAYAQHNGGDSDKEAASSTLVIPIMNRSGGDGVDDDPLAAKRAQLYNFDAEKSASKAPGSVPILQQNAVPGLDELADVTEKYRHDVSMRPDAPDVYSEAYESVPVEDFGAAMLRGMGWKGSATDKEDADDPKPRQKLLGLGATAKPKLAGDKGKNGHTTKPFRRNDEKPRSNGLNQREDDGKSKKDKRGDDDRDKSERNARHRDTKESSRARSRSRDRGRGKEGELARKYDRDDDDRRRDRDRDHSRAREKKGKESEPSGSRDRGRSGRERDRRDERSRDSRKRSRSRNRSSDRKKSGRR